VGARSHTPDSQGPLGGAHNQLQARRVAVDEVPNSARGWHHGHGLEGVAATQSPAQGQAHANAPGCQLRGPIPSHVNAVCRAPGAQTHTVGTAHLADVREPEMTPVVGFTARLGGRGVVGDSVYLPDGHRGAARAGRSDGKPGRGQCVAGGVGTRARGRLGTAAPGYALGDGAPGWQAEEGAVHHGGHDGRDGGAARQGYRVGVVEYARGQRRPRARQAAVQLRSSRGAG
jgi:hypothetical protein